MLLFGVISQTPQFCLTDMVEMDMGVGEKRGIRTRTRRHNFTTGLGKSRHTSTLDLRGSGGKMEGGMGYWVEPKWDWFQCSRWQEKTCSFTYLTQRSPVYLLPKSLLTANDQLQALPKAAGQRVNTFQTHFSSFSVRIIFKTWICSANSDQHISLMDALL